MDHPSMHAWDQIAPSAAEQQAQAELGDDGIRHIEQEDLHAWMQIQQFFYSSHDQPHCCRGLTWRDANRELHGST